MAEEVREISFPFNAVENELGQPDRIYDAEEFARYWARFIGNGVYPNPSNNLKVESLNENMVAIVHPGAAFLNGYGYELKDQMSITISASHPAYMRKDSVVVRLDLTNRYAKVLYKEGIAAASPLVPELVRNDDIYDLRICEITVKSGVQKITQADILDTRLNATLCGIVQGVVEQVDPTEIFNQYKTYLDQQISAWETRKTQQQTDWQNQMASQQTEFDNALNNRTDEFDSWIGSAKADITTLQSFYYQNWFELQGCVYSEYPKDANGKFISEIRMAVDSKLIAKQEEWKDVSGDYYTKITTYNSDGSTKKTRTKREYKTAEGIWKGEVT